MDLFGRGYSDSPDLPHDARLYTTQILIALTSSPLPWTPDGFSVVGYSMGGGICADFAGDFPELVRSVVLLAPGGLVRPYHFGWVGAAMLNGFVPTGLLEWIGGRRLQRTHPEQVSTPDGDNDLVEQEVTGKQFEDCVLQVGDGRKGVTVAKAMAWQLRYHEGFVRSYVSSLRFASITGRGESWKKLRARKDKVIIMLGETDAVIVKKEIMEDAERAIGKDGIDWKFFDAGHELPITKGKEIVEELAVLWGL